MATPHDRLSVTKEMGLKVRQRLLSQNRLLKNAMNFPFLNTAYQDEHSVQQRAEFQNRIQIQFHISLDPKALTNEAFLKREYEKFARQDPKFLTTYQAPWSTIDRAAYALESVFEEEEYQDLQVWCIPIDNTPGKEITIFSNQEIPIQRTADQWKTLMLKCWNALRSVGTLGLGYAKTPVDSVAVTTRDGIYSPFSIPAMIPEANTLRQVDLRTADLQAAKVPLQASAEVFLNYQHNFFNHPAYSDEVIRVKTFAEMLRSSKFWMQKHHSRKALPKGLLILQSLAQLYLDGQKTLENAKKFFDAARSVAIERKKAFFTFSRDPLTSALYDLLIKPDVGFACLYPYREFRRLDNAYRVYRSELQTQLNTSLGSIGGLLKNFTMWQKVNNGKVPQGIQILNKKWEACEDTYESRQKFVKESQSMAKWRLALPKFLQRDRVDLTRDVYRTLSKMSDVGDLLDEDRTAELETHLRTLAR